MQNLIKEYIDGIDIGKVQSYKNLSVFPLVSDYNLNLNYLTLDEALDANAIDVVELDQEGSVPELKVVNKSDTMILILDGEELVGAKQNRMDCFGKPETFKKVFEKLVESYALDAIDTPEKKKSAKLETDKATKFVHSPTTCKVDPHPSVGLGTDCRLESKKITGFALAHNKKILHLSAFSRQGLDSKDKSFTRMIRSSHRRRFRS